MLERHTLVIGCSEGVCVGSTMGPPQGVAGIEGEAKLTLCRHCPLLGVKGTWRGLVSMSANNPKADNLASAWLKRYGIATGRL